MPNDNNKTTSDNPKITSNDAPPIFVEPDALPPMANLDLTTTTLSEMPPAVEEEKKEEVKTETKNDIVNPSPTDTHSGSAAPSDDILQDTIMPAVTTSTPKKKFAGGKIIATILGLFLLVGGVGAGVYLTQQNQNINEQAKSTECACGIKLNGDCKTCSDGTSGDCPCGLNAAGSGCKACPDSDYTPTGNNDGETEQTCEFGFTNTGACKEWSDNSPDPTNPPMTSNNNACANTSECDSGMYCSIVPNKVGGTCLKNGTCNEDANCASGSVCTNNVCITDSNSCRQGDLNAPGCCQMSEYECQTSGGEIVCESGALGGRKECKAPSGQHCTFSVGASSGCGGSNTGGGTTTTTTTPTASCQNIKAYSETWVLLTNTQLSALKAGDKVNFCVTGVASEGIFDKAMFTINGIALPETTLVRPTSTDFCQLYTVPVATTSFNVTAQINHVTLEWK